MKSNSNEPSPKGSEQLKGFSTNFSIYSLVRKVSKKPQTIQTIQRKGLKIQETEEKDVQPSGAKEKLAPLKGKPSPYVEIENKKVVTPGDCENCPAAGFWDWGPYAGKGLICGHRAYFLGKSGKPSPCSEVRGDCPLGAKP